MLSSATQASNTCRGCESGSLNATVFGLAVRAHTYVAMRRPPSPWTWHVLDPCRGSCSLDRAACIDADCTILVEHDCADCTVSSKTCSIKLHAAPDKQTHVHAAVGGRAHRRRCIMCVNRPDGGPPDCPYASRAYVAMPWGWRRRRCNTTAGAQNHTSIAVLGELMDQYIERPALAGRIFPATCRVPVRRAPMSERRRPTCKS